MGFLDSITSASSALFEAVSGTASEVTEKATGSKAAGAFASDFVTSGPAGAVSDLACEKAGLSSEAKSVIKIGVGVATFQAGGTLAIGSGMRELMGHKETGAANTPQSGPPTDAGGPALTPRDERMREISGLLNDPSLSIDAKVALLMARLVDGKEGEIKNLLLEMGTAEGQTANVTQQKLQMAIAAKNELEALATSVSRNQHDTRSQIIGNIR